MPLTEAEIKKHYKNLHDELTAAYYSGVTGLTKEQFDQQHAGIWEALDLELIAAGYKQPQLPGFDAEAEIGALKQRVNALEGRAWPKQP